MSVQLRNQPLKIKLRALSYLALLLASLTLLFLPADFFDNGQSICISVLLLDKTCYACGMTRAIQHLIHFEFQAAYEYNWLSFIVFPLLVYVILTSFFKFRKELKESSKNKEGD